jgi:hypothetical protein
MTQEEMEAFAQCYDLLGQVEAFHEQGDPFPYLEIYHGGFIALKEPPPLHEGNWMGSDGSQVDWRGWQKAAQGMGQVLVTLQADAERAKNGGGSPLARLWYTYSDYSKALKRAGRPVPRLLLDQSGAGALYTSNNKQAAAWATFEAGISLLETLRKGENP